MSKKYRNAGHIHFTNTVVYNRQPVFSLDEAYCHIVIDNLKFYHSKLQLLVTQSAPQPCYDGIVRFKNAPNVCPT